MSDTKISALTAGNPAVATDVLPIARSGANFKLTIADIWAGVGAGQGPAIAAGTAITDVAALAITRTNNHASVATGVKITYTDTLSAAGFLPLQILGGSAGTTDLFNINKSGVATAPFFVVTSYFRAVSGSKGFVVDAAESANLSLVSTGVIGVGTGTAGSVAGTISAAAYISGGSAGVDFGPAVATNITVKKGIITAIS